MCCHDGRLPCHWISLCLLASQWQQNMPGLSSWPQKWAERAAQGRRHRCSLRQRGGHGRRAAKGVAEATAVQRLHARRRRRRVARAALALTRGATRSNGYTPWRRAHQGTCRRHKHALSAGQTAQSATCRGNVRPCIASGTSSKATPSKVVEHHDNRQTSVPHARSTRMLRVSL